MDILQLVEKVGGFHDGLSLIMSVMIGPVAASYFLQDFVKDSKKDPYQPDIIRKSRAKLARKLEEMQKGELLDRFESSIIRDAINRLIPIKISVKVFMLNIFCRLLRGNKGYKKIQRLADFKTAQLDIRSIISNSIALKDYFNCSLTRY